MRRMLAAILILLFLTSTAAYASPDHSQKVARVYYKSGNDYHPAGSGFFIDNGYVITNEHVVSNFFANSAPIYVTGGQKSEYITARLVVSEHGFCWPDTNKQRSL